MTKEEREKKNKKLGWIITGVAHVVIILLMFAFRLPAKEKIPEPLITLDFTAGSSSKGGSSSEPNPSDEKNDAPENPVDPVKTQDTESDITKSSRDKSTSGTTDDVRKPNTEASAEGKFGNKSGNKEGDKEGTAPGEDNGTKPGVGGMGTLGSNSGKAPKVKNPTKNETGLVTIIITVHKSGRVESVQVDRKNSRTTSPILFKHARETGKKYKFKPFNNGYEYSTYTTSINYALE